MWAAPAGGRLTQLGRLGPPDHASGATGRHPVDGLVGQRVRHRHTTLWWVLWISYLVAGKLAGNLVMQDGTFKGLMGGNVDEGVILALEIAVAILGIVAFAAWVPAVRGLSQAQTELARQGLKSHEIGT